MVRRRWLKSVALLALVLGGGACSANEVGRRCFIGAEPENPTQAIVTSPALECASRTCLHVPLDRELPKNSEYADLCTAECSSEEDCDKVPESPCQTGFTCAVATVTGPFCCRKLCICKDYLVIPDGGPPPPLQGCDPTLPQNTCINLEGRGS